MKKYLLFTVILVIAVCLAVRSSKNSLADQKEETRVPAAAAAPPQRPADTNYVARPSHQERAPTPQEVAFAQTVIMPLLDQAGTTFPVPSVRKLVAKFFTRTQGGDIKIIMQVGEAGRAMAVSTALPDGQKVIYLWLQSAMQEYAAAEFDPPSFQLHLVEILLHEGFHIDHHLKTKASPSKAESDAWWHIVEKIYVPTRQARLLPKHINPTTVIAIKAYDASGGDPKHPAWRNFVKRVIVPN